MAALEMGQTAMEQSGFDGNRRVVNRKAVSLAGFVKVGSRARIPCMVRNISPSGALIEFATVMDLPQRFRLDIDSDLFEVECEVRHLDGPSVGVEFTSNRQGAVALYG
jgi:hypothetical protein